MGQTNEHTHLPLPGRIPLPDKNDKDAFLLTGIQTKENEEDEPLIINGAKYVKYELPDKWKIVDTTQRSDIPGFIIIDYNKHKRVIMCGSWKGYPDDCIKIIQICNGPDFVIYEPRNTEKKIMNDMIQNFVVDIANNNDPHYRTKYGQFNK